MSISDRFLTSRGSGELRAGPNAGGSGSADVRDTGFGKGDRSRHGADFKKYRAGYDAIDWSDSPLPDDLAHLVNHDGKASNMPKRAHYNDPMPEVQ